ncbi:hypothetical protein KZZ52_06880 [Dactylosporangium sp. AC04546]|uniref:FtsX-like permease family protein n=1 Tax=Dactylosporangium sp. AC04546 TaxID=2862460 RepID=UPI001EDD1455|nr:FtsX-like permease family protein [Dactylosporangium sp. AC04546]WVK85120.1 hypothetical protein KZZ52_06880 [Dactylosporangium sp. AC04546]
MIGLVLSMIRARPGQAVTAFLLAMFALAAAVSAPVYTTTADRAVVASEVASAPVEERVVQARRQSEAHDRGFEDLVPDIFRVPGFTSVFSTEVNTYMATGAPGVDDVAPRLVYRDNACAHLRLVAGRCFISETEVVVGRATFDKLKLTVGGTVEASYATYDSEGQEWIRNGPILTLTVVGAYEVLDTSEQYWSDLDYFDPRPTDRKVIEPVLASRRTLEAIEHVRESQALDVVIDDDAITGETLQTINDAVKQGRDKLIGLPGGPTVRTELPALIERIDKNRSLVGEVVPVAAVPLVLLCWFVLFIAVASATQERRLELGLLALRGLSAPRRWWLAAGESILPILAGAGAGFFLGHYLVRLAAWLLLSSSASVPLSSGANWWALTALVGALFAALLAQRAELAKRTVDLLRNVPSRLSRWGAPVFEVAVIALAVVAVVQLRQGGGGLTGFAVFAPSLIVIALALVAARGVLPIAERVGRRAMREGRIGRTLAAYAMSRRPGSQRVLALLVVAVALMCFAATAASASSDTRDERVRVELGAPRVLTVETVSRAALLAKVRAIDPDGKFAMAAAEVPVSEDTGVPPMLAVDSRALAATALWDDAHLSAAEAAGLLHPAGPRDPIIVTNKDLSLDVTIDKTVDAFRVRWTAVVVPLDGSTAGQVDLGLVQLGRHTYTRNLPMCVEGCRLVSLQMDQPEGRGFDVTMTLHGLSQAGKVIADAAGFADTSQWRVPETPGSKLLVPKLTSTQDGLRAEVANYRGADVAVKIMPTDVPSPLPVVIAGRTAMGDHMTAFDGGQLSTTIAGEVGILPRVADRGALVDLDYAERMSTDAGDARQPQIWLGPAAPPDILDRVRDQGLTVASDRSIEPLRAALDEQGPAVALRFHQLAGGLAVLLAVGALWMVASLDRQRRSGELRALRAQGVARRDAATSGYLALVGTAVLIGPFAALVSWLLVREYLPVFTDDPGTFEVSYWPSPIPVAVTWLAAGVLLAGAAVVAGARLRAATRGKR